uniref:AAA family ATPase n=2 Tax=Succinivibrio sp. TaxID=2053619 RepID=UPI00402A81EE
MKFTKLLPSSCNFRDLIDNNRVYVDKTALICQIAKDEKGPYFISRPRRFGKSTLINTFHELFAHGTERFKGLEIEPLWKDKTYKVIHLDFSTFREVPSNSSFNKEFMDAFKLSLEEAGIEPTKENIDSPANLLKKTLDTESEVVLLVDEYDAPLTAVLNDSNEFEDRRKILSNFYLTVKSCDGKFRFIFITGVTYYSHTSIFSAFNNLKDLTLDLRYGALLGYTSEELELYFGEYIDNAVEVLNKKYHTERYTHDLVVSELKRNYDGYSFDEEALNHVYNPWSIVNFFDAPVRGFIPYWVVSGGSTPTFLVNYLKQGLEKYNTDDLQSLLNIDSTVNSAAEYLYPKIENMANLDLFAILYQAGYFCIKAVVDDIFKVGIPNLEVKKAYSNIVLNELTKTKEAKLKYVEPFKDVLASGNLDKIKELFNTFINEFSYETVKNFNEACFRDVLKLAMLTFNVTASTEVMGACGRADITAEAGDYLYVFELKVTDNSKDIDTKLTEAKEQIIKNKYARRLTDKTVIPVALVLENNSKSREKSDTPVCEIVALEKV